LVVGYIGGGGEAADAVKLTQETEQEAESGDVAQPLTVTSEGNSSNQCAGVLDVSNTGATHRTQRSSYRPSRTQKASSLKRWALTSRPVQSRQPPATSKSIRQSFRLRLTW
jgi:hypothetical protein